LAFFAAVLAARALEVRLGLLYVALAAGIWVALLQSGVEPVVVGLAIGLLTYAYPAARSDLERASERFRAFREQPTPELARSAGVELRAAVSPNERLQQLYHPWTSYLIVPLFAAADAGIAIDRDFLARALGSPITLGIFFGYVVCKPAGILGWSLLVTRVSGKRVRPPVGWAAVAGGGTIAGIGFTVSLLVATIAFDGPELDAGDPCCGALRGKPDLAAVSGDGVPAATHAAPRASRTSRAVSRPLHRRRAGARPHPRADRRACHSGRVRRLRMPLLLPSRTHRP
jgi:Na+/H+ antiporter NhaA